MRQKACQKRGQSNTPFPRQFLPPIPLPPPRRRHRLIFDRKACSPEMKAEYDRLFLAFLRAVRNQGLRAPAASAVVARSKIGKGRKAKSILTTFYAYSTAKERAAADVDGAIWRRRWQKIEPLLATEPSFIAVCRKVAKSERISYQGLESLFYNSNLVTASQRRKVKRRFPGFATR